MASTSMQFCFEFSLFSLAAKVCVGCVAHHRTEHFNEGAHAVVTDGNRNIGNRFALCEHFKRGKKPHLLPPATEGDTCLGGECTHESSPAHAGEMRPVVQSAVVGDFIHKSASDSGQPLILRHGQTQRLRFGPANLIPKNRDQTLLGQGEGLPGFPVENAMNDGE